MIGLTVEQLAEIISLADAHGRRTMRYVCDGHEVDSRQANEAYRTLIDTLRTAIARRLTSTCLSAMSGEPKL